MYVEVGGTPTRRNTAMGEDQSINSSFYQQQKKRDIFRTLYILGWLGFGGDGDDVPSLRLMLLLLVVLVCQARQVQLLHLLVRRLEVQSRHNHWRHAVLHPLERNFVQETFVSMSFRKMACASSPLPQRATVQLRELNPAQVPGENAVS